TRQELEANLCIEAIGSVDTDVSSFLEAPIATMAKQFKKLFTNSAHETHSGLWCKDYEVEGH
ncbi:hypothetical protein KI387_016450, partial [Taxus chinensis]